MSSKPEGGSHWSHIGHTEKRDRDAKRWQAVTLVTHVYRQCDRVTPKRAFVTLKNSAPEDWRSVTFEAGVEG